MKKYFLLLIVFSSIVYSFGVEKERKVIISNEIVLDYIKSDHVVLDEWKNPGLYSPANILDGDINTCFAENHVDQGSSTNKNNSFNIEMKFKNPVYVDEVRIMNGFGKNEKFFKSNNRLKKITFDIREKYTDPIQTEFILKDQRDFQNIKFEKSCIVSIVTISNDGKDESIYKGDKYDDTCITEIEFYNQGKKIQIKNISEVKEGYLQGITNYLTSLFPPKSARKNRWLVKDNKLYKKVGEEWILRKYCFIGDGELKVFDEKDNCTHVTVDSDNYKCQN